MPGRRVTRRTFFGTSAATITGAGVEIHTATRALSIERAAAGGFDIEVAADSARRTLHADRVVCTAAAPVAVKPVAANGAADPPFEAALLLPAANDERGKTAITPPGCYRLQRNLFIDNGEILLMIRAKRLLERGVGYEWFEYEELTL